MDTNGLKTTEAQRKASLKWEQANNEKVTVKFRSNGQDGFTKDDLRKAAKDSGQSVNAWIIEAIREKLGI